MANPSEAELVLRGDVGIKWKKGTGQFEEPVDPANPVEVDGTTYPVHMYLDSSKIGASAALAPENNDQSNQVQIAKKQHKPIKWYVKVPGGGGEQHHDDYSYHSPPWYNGGSSSSSPPYGSIPSEDPTSGGQTSPPSTGRDPAGGLYIGEFDPSPLTNAPSQQAQFGGAPPASPGLTQRFNVFPKRTNLNPIALRTVNKYKGFTNIEVELLLKPSDAIGGGDSVEMNVIMIPFTDLDVPSQVYRAAVVIDSTVPGGSSAEWSRVKIPFRGFARDQAFPITFALERRSDVSPNANVEIWVMQTFVRGVR